MVRSQNHISRLTPGATLSSVPLTATANPLPGATRDFQPMKTRFLLVPNTSSFSPDPDPWFSATGKCGEPLLSSPHLITLLRRHRHAAVEQALSRLGHQTGDQGFNQPADTETGLR